MSKGGSDERVCPPAVYLDGRVCLDFNVKAFKVVRVLLVFKRDDQRSSFDDDLARDTMFMTLNVCRSTSAVASRFYDIKYGHRRRYVIDWRHLSITRGYGRVGYAVSDTRAKRVYTRFISVGRQRIELMSTQLHGHDQKSTRSHQLSSPHFREGRIIAEQQRNRKK